MESLWCLLRVIALLMATSCTCAYSTLSAEALDAMPNPTSEFDINNMEGLLGPILRPRVPGTAGSLEVLQHFSDFFSKSLPLWKVELHNSSSTTPSSGGKLIPFVNFIATRDPPWSQPGNVGRLALTAHYDSLTNPEGFIGAIDSAAPCAMLMYAASQLDAALTRKWENMETTRDELESEDDSGVQIILFDGEEAFVSWTATDSIYGSRALAEYWESQPHAAMSTYHNFLSSISLFVLLDLLGSSSPRIPSYFATTHWAYQAMSTLEQRLRDQKLFKAKHDALWLNDAGRETFSSPYMGDDHLPWLARGVQILHMIPSPFPPVWHKISDDGEHLDMDSVVDWAKIVTAFVAEWLELEPYMHKSKFTKRYAEKSEL